jgi:mannosyltransferase
LGADEFLLRLPSALAGASTIPLVYLLGRRLYTPAAGLAGAALLSVNPYHVVMSQEARGYALWGSLAVGSYLVLDLALRHGSRRHWIFAGFVNALAAYCHFYTAFVILAQGVFVLSRRSRTALTGFLLGGLVTALLLAQLLSFSAGRSELSRDNASFDSPAIDELVRTLLQFTGGNYVTLAIYLALALLAMASRGRISGYGSWLLLTWLLVTISAVFAISQFRRNYNERYLLAVLPALGLLSGAGLTRLPLWSGAAAFAVVAGISVVTLAGDFRARRVEEWRQAVAYATSRAEPGDGWIFISRRTQNAFEYYAGWQWGRNPFAPYEHVLEPLNWATVSSGSDLRRLSSVDALEPFAEAHRRVWLVLSHEFDGRTGSDGSAPVRDWLSRHGYAATPRQLDGVRVLLYRHRVGEENARAPFDGLPGAAYLVFGVEARHLITGLR